VAPQIAVTMIMPSTEARDQTPNDPSPRPGHQDAGAEDARSIDWLQPPATFLDVGHSELAYRKLGQGPDLVLVHGWPVSSSTWRGMLPALAERFTCHLVDLPGAGFTRWHDRAAIELGAHVETMQRAIERMGLARYALLAHDSGAAVARHLAARDAERVTGLVMGNTEIPGHHPWQLALYLAAARLPGGSAAFTALLRSRRFRHSGLGFGTCFEDPAFADGAFHELCVRPILEDARHREGTLALLDTFDLTVLKELPRVHRAIQAPVLLVWGKNDPFFPLAKARKMIPQFRQAELIVLDPGKLFVHEERPDAFAEAAVPFFERCFAPERPEG